MKMKKKLATSFFHKDSIIEVSDQKDLGKLSGAC